MSRLIKNNKNIMIALAKFVPYFNTSIYKDNIDVVNKINKKRVALCL